jgi:hypothetical protein
MHSRVFCGLNMVVVRDGGGVLFDGVITLENRV